MTVIKNHDKITKYKMAALANMIRTGIYDIDQESVEVPTDYDPLGGP